MLFRSVGLPKRALVDVARDPGLAVLLEEDGWEFLRVEDVMDDRVFSGLMQRAEAGETQRGARPMRVRRLGPAPRLQQAWSHPKVFGLAQRNPECISVRSQP